MSEVELKRSLKLSELEAGKIFNNWELIIDIDKKTMTTIGWDKGIGPEGVYDIRAFMYDLKVDNKGNILLIDNNGYGEIYPNNLEYKRYSEQLKNAGLNPED